LASPPDFYGGFEQIGIVVVLWLSGGSGLGARREARRFPDSLREAGNDAS
jgi:hypothetical protein